MDPFSSFDLFRRRVDQMFADFDQQMFGISDPFDSPFFVPQRRMMMMQPSQQPTLGHEKSDSNPNPKEEEERILPHQPTESQSQTPTRTESQSHLQPHPLTSSTLRPVWPLSSSSTLVPSMKVNLMEEKDRFLIDADVPGFTKDQLEVNVHDGILTVSGKTTSSSEENDPDRKYHRVERSSGSLYRSMRLPEQIKEDEISATCENGVLKLVLPKDPAKEKKLKQIRVM